MGNDCLLVLKKRLPLYLHNYVFGDYLLVDAHFGTESRCCSRASIVDLFGHTTSRRAPVAACPSSRWARTRTTSPRGSPSSRTPSGVIGRRSSARRGWTCPPSPTATTRATDRTWRHRCSSPPPGRTPRPRRRGRRNERDGGGGEEEDGVDVAATAADGWTCWSGGTRRRSTEEYEVIAGGCSSSRKTRTMMRIKISTSINHTYIFLI